MISDLLFKLLREAGYTVATAESCTGGMVGAAITDRPDSSTIFDRGFITYSNESKTEMLGVRPETIEAHGAVSEEVAREMAEGARERAKVTVAVSITGIAGPRGTERKPEGRVCFGVASPWGTRTETVEFGAQGRDKVRALATEHALELLHLSVERAPKS